MPGEKKKQVLETNLTPDEINPEFAPAQIIGTDTNGLDFLTDLADSKTVIEKSPLGISVRDNRGRLISYNKAWLQIWRISQEDLTDYTERERSHLIFDYRDDYLGEWRDQVRNIYEKGGSLHIPELSLKISRKGGDSRWLAQYFYGIPGNNGQVDRVVIFTEDITARKKAEEALRNSEAQYRSLQDNLPIGVFRMAWDGHFISANPAMATMLGFDRTEELCCCGFEEFCRDIDDFNRLRKNLIEAGAVRDHQIRLLKSTGVEIRANIYARAISDSLGQVIYIDGLCEDITEKELARERIELARMEKYKQAKTIAGFFAHEIRNALFPATAALNRLKNLSCEKEAESAQVIEFLNIAEKAVINAAATTKLISDYTRLDSELQPEGVNLNEVIRKVLDENRLRIDENHVGIDISGPEKVWVKSNHRQLQTVFNNLLLNSIDAIGDKPDGKIKISWKMDNHLLHLEFEDNGYGIPEEKIDSIFDLFYTTKRKNNGSGVGLAITRKIIEMYGGSIHAESDHNNMTRFKIRLLAKSPNSDL